LEKERLERQKRFRAQAGLDDLDEKKQSEAVEPPAKRPRFTPSSSEGDERTNLAVASSSATHQASSSAESSDKLFWDGELRQVANRYADPRADGKPTFGLTEILGKVGLKTFLTMSFSPMFL